MEPRGAAGPTSTASSRLRGTLEVPVGGGAPAVTVEVWLWQHVENDRRLRLSVRLPPQSWEVLRGADGGDG